MEPILDIPYCPIPPETISEVIPMGVILGVFVLGGWLFRRRRKKRDSKRRK